MSTERIKLFKKIAQLQQKAPVIHKSTKGYGYTYADLTTIFTSINPLMKEFGLGFWQGSEYYEAQDANVITTTIFCTETGESIESSMKVDESVELKGMNKYQILGSSITYYKRYMISSMLGLITDKDIDAAGEQPHNKEVKKQKLTPTIKKAMRQFWLDGKKSDVESRIKSYEYTDKDWSEITAKA